MQSVKTFCELVSLRCDEHKVSTVSMFQLNSKAICEALGISPTSQNRLLALLQCYLLQPSVSINNPELLKGLWQTAARSATVVEDNLFAACHCDMHQDWLIAVPSCASEFQASQ